MHWISGLEFSHSSHVLPVNWDIGLRGKRSEKLPDSWMFGIVSRAMEERRREIFRKSFAANPHRSCGILSQQIRVRLGGQLGAVRCCGVVGRVVSLQPLSARNKSEAAIMLSCKSCYVFGHRFWGAAQVRNWYLMYFVYRC